MKKLLFICSVATISITANAEIPADLRPNGPERNFNTQGLEQELKPINLSVHAHINAIPEPERHFNVAEPSPLVETELHPINLPKANKQNQVLEVDNQTLLANPALLERAMSSAIVAQNTAAIQNLLPLYQQLPKHDPNLIKYGQAILKQSDGHAGEAVKLYQELITERPDATPLQFQLAQALFEDKQNKAANKQFSHLAQQSLPENIQHLVSHYQAELENRDAWQFYANLGVTHDKNINQAPEKNRLGYYLDDIACQAARYEDPSDSCFRGWSFENPINSWSINYQVGAEKKWSLDNGFYTELGINSFGKHYPAHTRYNDMTARASVGIGHANQRNDLGISPFHERRFYGKHAYTYTNGARLHWNRWHTPRIQTLTAFEYGNRQNIQQQYNDINSYLYSGSLLFLNNPRQYWLVGADLYQERNKNDRSDNFNRHSIRLTWGQEWPLGFASRAQISYAKRLYQTPSFFSQDERRRDHETDASLSLWHNALSFKGLTPKLTVMRSNVSSNDLFYDHSKNKMFIEINKNF